MENTSPVHVFLLSVFAAACGFAISRCASSEPRGAVSTSGAVAPSRDAKTAATRAFPNPLEGDWRTAEGRLLTALKSGSKDELTGILLAVLADDRTPPRLRELRVETLTRRIVELGGAEELLALGGLRAADREQVASAAIRAVAEVEPAAAERLVAAMPAGSARALAMAALLETLAGNAPERGLALLKADKSSRQHDSYFFSAWAKKDPKAAADAALALRKEYESFALDYALSQWARDDSGAAIQWSEQLQGEQRKRALGSCMFGLGATDPAAAAAYFIKHPGDVDDYIAHDMLNGLEGDPRRVAEEVLAKVPPGNVRTRMLEAIAQSFAADPAQALDWAGTLLPGERESVTRSIFHMASQSQPEEMFQLALDKLTDDNRRSALSTLLKNWAGADFDAAFRAATENLDADELRRALPTIFRGSQFLFSDPGRSLRMLSKLDPQLRSDLLKDIGRNMGSLLYRSGVHEALGPADRDDLLEGTLQDFSERPALAREVAAALPEDRKHAQVEVITRALAYEDPQRAAEFALTVTGHDEQKRRALENLANDWAYTDPAAAEAFLRRLPPGDIRTAVARKLAERFRTFDSDAAARVEAQLATP